MEKTEIYLELEKGVLGLDRLTHLNIEVYYDKGGWSCLTGESHDTAVCCRVQPIEIQEVVCDDGSKSRIFGSVHDRDIRHTGFYVPVIPCKGYPKKKIAVLFEKVKGEGEKIKELFINGEYKEIDALLKELGNNI